AWTSWATVPGTGSGTQARNFISGYPRVAGGQVGLIWTEGTTTFNVVAAALETEPAPSDTVAPTVTAAPAPGTFTSAQSVTLVASEPATIYYTLDGTAPTAASARY